MKKHFLTIILALTALAGYGQQIKTRTLKPGDIHIDTASRSVTIYKFMVMGSDSGKSHIAMLPDSSIKVQGDTIACIKTLLLEFQRQIETYRAEDRLLSCIRIGYGVPTEMLKEYREAIIAYWKATGQERRIRQLMKIKFVPIK